MSSFLAIDFGERRTGIASGDTDAAMVFPLTTINRTSDEELIARLLQLAEEHHADTLILGLPTLPDGSENHAAQRVRSFGRKLEGRCELPVVLVTETLTSVEARRRIGPTGSRNKRRSPSPERQLDAVAAQIIGEQFLAHDESPDGGQTLRPQSPTELSRCASSD